jgi:hypothetical protein
MPRITRKKAKRSTSTTQKAIPSIRRDFDAFHAFLRVKPRSEAEVRTKFKELFGKGKKLSRDHVATLLKMPPQKGGMAPLDYTMGSPDARLSALPYVQRGFGFANMNSLTEGGAKEYLGMTPQMGGGSKSKSRSRRQRGGGVADFAASVSAQPFLSSAPLTILQAGARLATGQIGLPSSHPEINHLSVQPATYVQGAKLV